MSSPRDEIAVAAGELAQVLPFSLVESLASALADGGAVDQATLTPRLLQAITHPGYRNQAARFLEGWTARAAHVTPEAVALALLTAAHAARTNREGTSVELVWTGPAPLTLAFRRTEQAILQVLDSAAAAVTIVSYAVYRIPFVCAALIRAAQRGVQITLIIETPDRVAGQHEYSTLQALGPEVAACCSVLYWPKEQRPQTEAGKLGILHVKCVVADGRWLFLSSANLTEYAFTINMELGVLVTGGPLPGRVESHFRQLRNDGYLELIEG